MAESGGSLHVQLRKGPGKTRVSLAGTLDLSNVDVLIDAFGSIRPGDQAGIIVDVGALNFLDASGINALILASARFARRCCPLVVVGANPAVLHMLRATALTRTLVWPPDDDRPSQATLRVA